MIHSTTRKMALSNLNRRRRLDVAFDGSRNPESTCPAQLTEFLWTLMEEKQLDTFIVLNDNAHSTRAQNPRVDLGKSIRHSDFQPSHLGFARALTSSSGELCEYDDRPLSMPMRFPSSSGSIDLAESLDLFQTMESFPPNQDISTDKDGKDARREQSLLQSQRSPQSQLPPPPPPALPEYRQALEEEDSSVTYSTEGLEENYSGQDLLTKYRSLADDMTLDKSSAETTTTLLLYYPSPTSVVDRRHQHQTTNISACSTMHPTSTQRPELRSCSPSLL